MDDLLDDVKEAMLPPHYIIRNQAQPTLYWSRAGWTDYSSAETYLPVDQEHMELPDGGQWVPIEEGVPVATAFGMPLGLSMDGQHAWRTVIGVLLQDGIQDPGCNPRVFAPAENGAELIIEHDGGAHAPFFNLDYGAFLSFSGMTTALRNAGYIVEAETPVRSVVFKMLPEEDELEQLIGDQESADVRDAIVSDPETEIAVQTIESAGFEVYKTARTRLMYNKHNTTVITARPRVPMNHLCEVRLVRMIKEAVEKFRAIPGVLPISYSQVWGIKTGHWIVQFFLTHEQMTESEDDMKDALDPSESTKEERLRYLFNHFGLHIEAMSAQALDGGWGDLGHPQWYIRSYLQPTNAEPWTMNGVAGPEFISFLQKMKSSIGELLETTEVECSTKFRNDMGAWMIRWYIGDRDIIQSRVVEAKEDAAQEGLDDESELGKEVGPPSDHAEMPSGLQGWQDELQGVYSSFEEANPFIRGSVNPADFGVQEGLLEDVDDEIKAAVKDIDHDPSDEQKEAGNYQKGHVVVHGLDLSIENRKGGVRSGKDKDGKEWKVTLPAHYGYIKGTEGKDKDHIDVFVGPDTDSEKVFVVNQQKLEGGFDEHKVMLCFNDRKDAVKTYDKAYNDGLGPKLRQSVVSTTVDKFHAWLEKGDHKKPFKDVVLQEVLDPDVPSLEQLTPFVHDRECFLQAEELVNNFPNLSYDDGAYLPMIEGGGHAWVKTPMGTIIDVTHSQIDPNVPILIAVPGSSEYSNYLSWREMNPHQYRLVYGQSKEEYPLAEAEEDALDLDFDWKDVAGLAPDVAKMKGDALAKAYTEMLSQKLRGDVSGYYTGGGWITVSGHNLPAHPDMVHLYPNGWSMGQNVRCTKARNDILKFQNESLQEAVNEPKIFRGNEVRLGSIVATR